MGVKTGSSGNEPLKPPRQTMVKPLGSAKAPFDPRRGKYFPMDAGGGQDTTIAIAVIVSEADDVLVCYFPDSYQEFFVAKPYLLRRTPFDGETVGSVTYVYSDENTRVASATGETDETQHITPDYYAGEEIIILELETTLELGIGEVQWIDMNTAGRCWATEV